MFDSQTDVSASISAGTTPFGLRRRYSGVRFPPNSPPTSSIWKAIPSSVRSHVTFWTLADVLRPRSLSMKRSCRRNRHAACDCRARADGIEPSLDVGNGRPFQPMQREACDPWIGRDIGDRIVVRRPIRTHAEFLVEDRVEPVDLLLVAPERVAFTAGISQKKGKQAEHRAYPAHLEHQPLEDAR